MPQNDELLKQQQDLGPQAPPMPPTQDPEDMFGDKVSNPGDLPINPDLPPEIKNIKSLIYSTQIDGVGAERDPHKEGKVVHGDFRNPNIPNQYIERYAKHGKDFDRLGFSPFRDNEHIYNENTSWWDDMGRAAGQWVTLTGLGFKDAMGFGDLSDTETARNFERAMGIGSSGKGGVGGFTTNLFLNSGYTFGIMGELAMEEAAMALAEVGLGAAGVFTGGTSWGGNVAVGAAMVSRTTRAGTKVKKAWQIGNKLKKTMDNMKDINKVRRMFSSGAKSAANFINPLENTFDLYRNRAKLSGLNNAYKYAKGAGALYRDYRMMRLAYGEGALEGGMVQNEMEELLAHEFEQEHGRVPNKEEAQQIRETALKAGTTTSLINMPVIFFSNKLVFDGLLRGQFRNIGGDVIQTGLGRRIMFTGKKGVPEAYKALSSNYFKAQWQLVKNPRFLLKSGGQYFNANVAEGLQEIAQETVGGASKDYFTAKYQGNALRGGYMSFVADNVAKQVSPQGFETFLSGFLMGGLVAPVSKVMGATARGDKTINDLRTRIFDNESWSKIQAERDAKLQEDINMLNEFYARPDLYFSPDLEAAVEINESERIRNQALQANDKKTYYDMEDSGTIKYITTALKYGRLNDFIEQLEDMRQLTPEEVSQLDTPLSHEEYIRKLNKTITHAKNIEATWSKVKEKFPNPFNPSKYQKNDPVYAEELIGQSAWDDAIEQMVFNQQSFQRALERRESIFRNAAAVSGLKNTSATHINVLFDHVSILEEVDLLKKELYGDRASEAGGLQAIESKTPEIKRTIRRKQKRLEKLQAFEEALKNVKVNAKGDESISSGDFAAIKKALTNYLTALGAENNDFVNKDNVAEMLTNILDHHILEQRAQRINQAVNTLTDPNAFIAFANRIKKIKEDAWENRKGEIEKSLLEYRELQDDNGMLNELMDLGIFFDPKELEALKESGRVPDYAKFYYMDVNRNKEVFVKSDDYRKALDILRKRLQALHNIEITEDQKSPYDSHSREKEEGDVRTFEQLATQFGFDPAAKESKVSLKKVLKAITKSPFASERERALAAKLLSRMQQDKDIVFAMLETPSAHHNGMPHVDARYSSHEYKQGRDASPLEHLILHQVIHSNLVEQLVKDEEFASDVKGLLDEVRAAYQKMSMQELEEAGVDPTRLLYGLTTPEAFVSEVMSNSRFQTFLGTVTRRGRPKKLRASGWQGFVDLVFAKVKEGLGKAPNGTVLNAAMEVITAKLDVEVAKVVKSEAPKTTGAKMEGLTNKTAFDVLVNQHPDLANEVLDIFKEENARRVKNGDDVLIVDIENKSDAEIFNSSPFKMFFRDPKWSKKEMAIHAYNRKHGLKTKPTQRPKAKPTPQSEEASSIVTVEMKNQLKALGYKTSEIKKMNGAQAQRFIAENLTKEERTAQMESDASSDLAEKAAGLRDYVTNVINAIETYEQWEDVMDLLLIETGSNPDYRLIANLTGEELLEMMNAALERIAFTVNFDAIQVGEVMMRNDGELTKVKVMKKNDTTIEVQELNEGLKVYPINKNEVDHMIKYRYTPALEKVTLSDLPSVTATEEEQGKETIENNEDINTGEAIRKDAEIAKEKSEEDLDNDLLNTICK